MKLILRAVLSKFWFLIALSLYPLVFIFPLPPQIQKRGIWLDDAIIFALAMLVCFMLARPYWVLKATSLFLALTLFTLPLRRIWENAESNYSLVLGLIPWSDANGYYSDAVNLLIGGLFGTFSGRRPLFSGYLSTLLAIDNQNLQITVILMTAIVAISFFLLALEASDVLNPIASFPIIVLGQVYYRQTIGTTMTEQLGLPLGALALGMLINASKAKNFPRFVLGILILTAALIARTGALFVIPMVAIAGISIFLKEGFAAPKTIFFLIGAIAIPILMNVILQYVITVPSTETTGNFAYAIYAQTKGGQDWQLVLRDHPEIAGLDEKFQSRAIYMHAIQNVIENPLLLAQGIFKSFRDYFEPGRFATFGFLELQDSWPNIYLQFICLILLVAGIIICWFHRSSPVYITIGTAFIGILISLPFAAPSLALWMRPYAATVPVTFMLLGLPLSEVFKILRHANKSEEFFGENFSLLATMGSILLAFAFIGPLMIHIVAQPQKTAHSCSYHKVPIQFRALPGTYVTLSENPTGFPSIGKNIYKTSLDRFPGVYQSFAEKLRNPKTPAVILYTVDNLSETSFWIIAPAQIAQKGNELIKACIPSNQLTESVIQIDEMDATNP